MIYIYVHTSFYIFTHSFTGKSDCQSWYFPVLVRNLPELIHCRATLTTSQMPYLHVFEAVTTTDQSHFLEIVFNWFLRHCHLCNYSMLDLGDLLFLVPLWRNIGVLQHSIFGSTLSTFSLHSRIRVYVLLLTWYLISGICIKSMLSKSLLNR